MKALWGKLGLVMGGLVIGALLVELTLRLAPAGVTQDLRSLHELRPDADWLYGLRPGAIAEPEGGPRYVINSEGFRDRPRQVAKSPGRQRIVIVGDSLTFGWGVEGEETFASRLEASLVAAGSEGGIEVLNLGVGGYNPYTEAALLRDRGLAYEPDLVLAQFCINDLADPTIHFDSHARTRLGTLPDAVFPDATRRTHDVGGRSVLENVCLASRLCQRIHDSWLARTQAKMDAPTRYAGAQVPDDPEGPEWKWLTERYREMAAAAERAGAEFALLIFPHHAQLAEPTADATHLRLKRLAAEEGWVAIDLLPPFRRAQARGERVLLDFWHPSSAGHALASREIERGLACAGLLPGLDADGCPSSAEADR